MAKKKRARRLSAGSPHDANGSTEASTLEYYAERILSLKQIQERRRMINEALESDPVDLQLLRQLALSRGGLLNDGFRQRAWPKMLGVNRYEAADYRKFITEHPEGPQLWRDVDRSFFHFKQLSCMKERERKQKRQQLYDIMNAVISQNPALTYYQGYHDICTVFLLVHDDRTAFEMSERVSQYAIRECMRPNFIQVIEILRMLFPIIETRDAEVFRFIKESGVEPFFALPWIITWFSHHLQDFATVTRLFDVFLSSHPLFSLYVSAAIVLQRKAELLKCECEFSVVHNFLSKFPADLDVEDAVQTALAIFEDVPPAKLVQLTKAKVFRNSAFLNYPFKWQSLPQRSDSALYKLWKNKNEAEAKGDKKPTTKTGNQSRFRLMSWPEDTSLAIDRTPRGKYMTAVIAVGTAFLLVNAAQVCLQRGVAFR